MEHLKLLTLDFAIRKVSTKSFFHS